jgi:uncharacterized protein (TIGR02145 family)
MKYCAVVFILSTVVNSSVSAQDTVQVKTGWNIIGAVKDGAVPDVLSTIPDSIITTSFFGYEPGAGYASTDTLGKGLGYWVKVKSDGAIIFKTTPAIDSCKSKALIYQGKLYHTVKIGSQCWMAENLDVGSMIDSLQNAADNGTIEKYCYHNDPLNCALYGGFYQWNEAMQYTTTPGTRGICPTGWHIPTFDEFLQLYSAVGGDGNALKAVGQGSGGGAGTDTSGFSALLSGTRDQSGSFFDLGSSASFWSSTEGGALGANNMSINDNNSSVYLSWGSFKSRGWGVRCLAD